MFVHPANRTCEFLVVVLLVRCLSGFRLQPSDAGLVGDILVSYDYYCGELGGDLGTATSAMWNRITPPVDSGGDVVRIDLRERLVHNVVELIA